MAILSENEEDQHDENSRPLGGDPAKKEEEMTNAVKEEAEKSKLLVPNQGNGLDMNDHSWTQLREVTVTFLVPSGTKSRQISCEIKKKSNKVGLRGHAPVLEGELFESVKVHKCFWNLEDQKEVSILMTKGGDGTTWWKSLLKGGAEIDTQKAGPEPSELADLDLETWSAVEKMTFDQRQKDKGLRTSDEIEKQELLKKFMARNPNMNFSKMRMV